MCLKTFFCFDLILWPWFLLSAFSRLSEWFQGWMKQLSTLWCPFFFFFPNQYNFNTATPTALVITGTSWFFLFFCTFSIFYIFSHCALLWIWNFIAIWRKKGNIYTLEYKMPCSLGVRKIPQDFQQSNFSEQQHFYPKLDHLYGQLILISRRIAQLNIATARS